MDALARAASRAGEISAAAVVVDAVDEAAVRFYKRYDFLALSDRPDRLFLPMTTILKLFPDR